MVTHVEIETEVPAPIPVLEEVKEPIEADIELVSEITQLAKAIENIETRISGVETAIEEVKQSITAIENSWRAYAKIVEWIGSWKCSRCRFCENGICKAWKLAEPAIEELKKSLGEDVVAVVDGVARFRVEKVPVLGALCPLFKPRT